MRRFGLCRFPATGGLSSGLKTTTLLMSIISITTKGEGNMVMHNPPHPGEVIRELCIEPLGLTVTEAADGLGVSIKTLSALVNGRFGISPKMAIRLSKAFGGSAESWITQQAQYDLWQALQKTDVTKVKAFA
ncbi:MAG: HigA family addiction module antitoxin [Desulfobacteraceae bacterium]|nr:HigA family addiction module antitoxin [Desulfobacteraceae bacterium]